MTSTHASTSREEESRGQPRRLLIVGIGVSAGGLEALEQFFSHVPTGSGLVYVVVQHLAPQHARLLSQLLGYHSTMPVLKAKDGTTAQADHVYVIAPGTLLGISGGAFHVKPIDAEWHEQIDAFLQTLADDQGEHAAGVILSGSGDDGTSGLRAIKRRGGLALAQTPETAKCDTMPRSAINAGVVDHVLPIDEMPAKLLERARQLAAASDQAVTPLATATSPGAAAPSDDFKRAESVTRPLVTRANLRATNEELQSANEELQIKNAEAGLRHLATVFLDSNDAVTVQDLEGHILDWNRTAERIYGYSAAEAKQMNAEMLVPEGGRAQARGLLEAIRRGEAVEPLEVKRRTKDGRTLDVWLTITKFVDGRGRPAGVVTTERDITGHKTAEEVLRASEEKYRTLFESIDEGFCVIEVLFDGADNPIDYRFLEVNRAFEKQTGIPSAVGRRMREVAPEHEEHWFRIYGRVALTGEPLRFEKPAVALGRYYDVYAFRIGKPEQRRVAILFNDVTGRRQMEAERGRLIHELRETQEQLSAELDATSRLLELGSLFVKAGNREPVLGAIVDVAIAISGADFGTIQLMDCESGDLKIAAHRGFPEWWVAFWERVCDGHGACGAALERRERIVVEDVEQSPIFMGTPALEIQLKAGVRAVQSTPLLRRSGEPIGMLSTHYRTPRRPSDREFRLLDLLCRQAADILERAQADLALEEANKRLLEADRRKDEFLGMLSHELRNPLAPIRSSLYILGRAAPGGEQARRAQAVIERQVGHMTRLIDDLLDVTRITRGKAQLQRELLGLNELVQRTTEDLHGAFAESGVELEVLAAPAEVWVNGDRTRLAQVIGNLLQNAVKFTPRGGRTTVSVERDSARGQAIVHVQDTGRGIAPEFLPRLFEPFTQADTTLDRSMGGLGLGLSLVKGLIEMHGGSVSAASGGLNKGTSFTIMLPLEAMGPAETHRSHAGTGQAHRRVLIIEDNTDAANSLRELLELCGHDVEAASTGPAGIEKARAFGPDVVICDIGLPGMDGFEVARAMRADPGLGRVTLVALTGYAGPGDAAKAREAGFDVHLAKPLSLEVIERILAGHGAAPRIGRMGPS